MAGAIGIAEAGDCRRGDLDLAARRRQRRDLGLAAESADDAAVPRLGRQDQFALLPELIETGGMDAALGYCAAGRFVDVFEPLPGRAAFGERLGKAETLGQRGEDVVIVARLAVGSGCA